MPHHDQIDPTIRYPRLRVWAALVGLPLLVVGALALRFGLGW